MIWFFPVVQEKGDNKGQCMTRKLNIWKLKHGKIFSANMAIRAVHRDRPFGGGESYIFGS